MIAASRFRRAPLSARLHVEVRRRLFPFEALLRHAPASGTLLDLGCGHGMFAAMLAEARPAATVIGIDPDAGRIEVARAMAESQQLANLSFSLAPAEEAELPRATMVSLVDVLYLMPQALQERVVHSAVRALEPGGCLLIKEMNPRPRWKYAWTVLQETLAVRIAGITRSQGGFFHFRDEREWVSLLGAAGLTVSVERLDAGYPHPHVLIRGTR